MEFPQDHELVEWRTPPFKPFKTFSTERSG